MPSIVTHTAMARDVLTSLNPEIQKKIDKRLYNVYSQSFDIFFYYNFLDFINGDRVRSFGHKCHGSNTQNYLLNLVKNIKEMHLENDSKALAYLYGSINHYVMDSVCHKFVYYKAGTFHKDALETYKYRGMHTYIEKNLDAYYSLYLFKKPIYKVNLIKEILGDAKFSKELVTLMNKTFKDTYDREKMGNYYVKSYKNTKLVCRLLMQDKFGIKRAFYSFLDIFNHKGNLLKNYSFYIKNPNINCLNINKNKWPHPCDNKIKYKDSFIDLYNSCIKQSLEIIEAVNKVLYSKKAVSTLKKVIPNVSYRTGLPLNKNKDLQYFEF